MIRGNKMKKKLFVLLIVFTIGFLEAKPIKFKTDFSAGMYYPKTPKFVIGNSLLNVRADFAILNLVDYWGIGGTASLDYYSFDPKIDKMNQFDIYLHRFWNSSQEKSFFIYGFFSGVRQTNLVFEDDESLQHKLYFARPFVGINFASEIWESRVFWTQTENRKSKWNTELITKNPSGIFILMGWSFNGPIDKIKSEYYLNLGYELFK